MLVLAAVAGINSAAQAQVTTYNIWVDGIQVTSQNATTGIGGTGIKSGKVTYDASTSTLLLDNAVIVRGGNACIEIQQANVKVKFRGVCALSCTSSDANYATVRVDANTTFECESGSHTTIYRSASHAVWLYNDNTTLTINGPGQLKVDTRNYLDTDGVTIKTTSGGKSGFVGKNGTQVLKLQSNHNVTINSRQACLWDFKDVQCAGNGLLYCMATNNSSEPCFVKVRALTLSGNQSVRLPSGAAFNSSDQSIVAAGVKVYAADVAIAGGAVVEVSFASKTGTLSGVGKTGQLKLYGDGYYTSGQSVTVTAVNDGADKDGITFVGWNNANTTSSVLSSSMKYSFSAKDISLYGHYKYYTYTITANASPTDGGSVNVYGSKYWGAEATVEATPAGDAWSFQGWYEGNTRVSTSATYKFDVKSNRTLKAKFYREYAGLKVGNVQVTSDNRDHITGGNIKSGYAVFDPEAKIVSMHNITIEGKERCFNECDLMSFKETRIKFYGNCSLASSNDATIFGRYIPIFLECTEGSNVTLKNTQTDGVAIWFTEQTLYTNSHHKVYILGAGNLTIQSQFYGIRKHPNGKSGTHVTFLQSGNVTINCAKAGISRFENMYTGDMTGTLTIKATNNSNNFQVNEIDQFVMANYQEMLPQGAFFNTATKRVEMSGSTPSAITTQDLVITHKTYTISASASPSEGGFISGAGSHKHGASVTLKATPNTGYKFVRWTENGSHVSASASYGFTASSNRTLQAVFEKLTYSITASASPAAGGTVTGGGTKEHGESVTVKATPNTGYKFVKWTEGGSQVSTSASYTFTANKNRTLVAVFEKLTYSITASASPAAGGTVTGGGTKEHGESVTVKATPNTGYKFVRWTEGGSQVSSNATYTFTADKNRTLVAVFEEEGTPDVAVTGVSLSPTTKELKVGEKFTLAPQISPSNATNQNVTWISSDATVATVSNGEVTAEGVGTATITVITADGNKTATCEVTVSAAAATTYALTIVSPTNGTLTASPSGNISEGTEVTLTATPASGYKLKALKAYKTGEPSTAVAINGNKFNMPGYPVTVEAEFVDESSAETYYPLTVVSPTNGTLTANPSGNISEGTEVTLTATPASGYKLKALKAYKTGEASTTVAITGNKFNMPAYEVTVEAEFEKTSSGGGGGTTYYTLTYTASAGGSIKGASIQTVAQGGSGQEVEAVAQEGYRFVKWSDGRTTAKRIDFYVQANLIVTAEFEKSNTTGIFDTKLDALSVYPNPTTGQLWVSVPELAEGTAAEVHVYNANGQLLQRVPAHGASAGSAASRLSIDLSGYPAGVYIIRVGNAVAKVVKQ